MSQPVRYSTMDRRQAYALARALSDEVIRFGHQVLVVGSEIYADGLPTVDEQSVDTSDETDEANNQPTSDR